MRTIIRDNYDPTPNEYHETIVVDEAREKRWLFDCDGVYHDITKVNVVSERGDSEEYAASQKWVTDEVEALEAADQALQDNIDAEATAREEADQALQDNIDAEAAAREAADDDLQDAIDDEAADRYAADVELWEEINTIEAKSDVVDVVGTHAELEAYDTSTLHDNDLIKVLQDETRNDAITYYRWSTSTSAFSYVGAEGPYYTTSETDLLIAGKQDTLVAGTNIQIAADGKTISATDTTYTAGANVSIDANNVISATDTTYSAFTGATSSTAGAAGLVPAPAAGDEGKVLKGDGTWGETSESVMLYVNSISDLVDYTTSGRNPHIYSDSTRQNALSYNEVMDIVLYPANNAPKEVWIMETNSSDAIYKVVGGYVQDLTSGFLITGPEAGTDNFVSYRISKVTDQPDDTLFKAELANPSSGASLTTVYLTYSSGSVYSWKDHAGTTAMSMEELYQAYMAGPVIVCTVGTASGATDVYSAVISAKKAPKYNDPTLFRYEFVLHGVSVAASPLVDDSKVERLQPYNSYESGTANRYVSSSTYFQEQLTAGTGITISGTTISASGGALYATEYPYMSGSFTMWNHAPSSGSSDYFSIRDDSYGSVYARDLYNAVTQGPVVIQGTRGGSVEQYSSDVFATAVVFYAEVIDYGGNDGYMFWVLLRPLESGGPGNEVIRKVYASTHDSYYFIDSDVSLGGTTYTAGTNIQINNGVISATDTTYSAFGGATSSVAGSAGLVPAPTTSDPDKYLKGDGTWANLPSANNISSNDWSGLWQ